MFFFFERPISREEAGEMRLNSEKLMRKLAFVCEKNYIYIYIYI